MRGFFYSKTKNKLEFQKSLFKAHRASDGWVKS